MKELLTGKCKEDFEKWYYSDFKDENADTNPSLFWFDRLPFSMQYGVYLEFFDSVDMFVYSYCYELSNGDFFYKYEIIGFYGQYDSKRFETRQEAQQQSIIKANSIYNERH